jgi:hypothetical protein
LNQIKEELDSNGAIISKADKGNSVVIIYQNIYHEKIMKLIGNNYLTSIKGDFTKGFQKELRSSINERHQIIQNDIKWKYINQNPSSPTISGLIKIHSVDSPVRPIVNWTIARAYKLAKILSKDLEIYIPLPHIFNVKNTIQLMKDQLEIPFKKDLKFVSFDITNM